MKKLFTTCFLIATNIVGYAQNNVSVYYGSSVYTHTQNSRSDNYPEVTNIVTKYDVYSIDSKKFFTNELNLGAKIKNFKFVLGENIFDFTIWKAGLRAANYSLRTGDGEIFQTLPSPEETQYKGYVNGDAKNTVRINLRNNHIEGIINLQGKSFAIQTLSVMQPEDETNNIVLYNSADRNVADGISCGVTGIAEEKVNQLENNTRSTSQLLAWECTEIALACDYSFRTKAGGTTQAETRLQDIFNFVQGYYDTHQIDYKIKQIYVETKTSNNTWGNHADAQNLLDNFSAWTAGFTTTFDVKSLYTATDFSYQGSQGVIGLAWIGKVCVSSGSQNHSNVVEYYNPWGNNYSMHAVDQAHELGHNWNAQHVNNCTGCIMTPALTGNNTTWSSQTVSSVSNYKNNASCLDAGSCTTTPLPPVAQFSANTTDGCGSLTVQFTDNSTNTPTSWLWNFGDGTPTSGLQNPSHNYSAPGSYNVSLTATNSGGSNPITKTNLITVGTGVPYTSVKGGPTSNTSVGAGGNFNTNDVRGLLFDVTVASIIESVKVYATGAGDRTIEVLTGVGGTVVHTKTVTIPNGESRVNLGFSMNVGTQYFIKVTGSMVDLYRNNAGASFPYNIGGLISITQTDYAATDPNYYYYFYDWEVRKKGCESNVGVNETGVKSGILLYPNPTKGILNINLSKEEDNRCKITVYNFLGAVVKETNIVLGKVNSTLDISSLTNGIYFIKIIDEQSIESIFRIVKN